MGYTIKESMRQKREGYYIGCRLILPFQCQLIKMMADNHIITEMVGSEDVKIQQDPHNTSIYFRNIGSLKSSISEFEIIKMIVCEWDDDLCDSSKHVKLVCEIKDGHRAVIHIPDSDILFIE